MGFVTVMCVNSEQVGYFFAKDFFSFSKVDIFKRGRQRTANGEAAGGSCRTPRINITDQKQARDRYQAICKSSGEWRA